MTKPWQEIRKRAQLDSLDGLGAFRLHDLRHNVVSWDVSRGVPLEIAGKNVGHRSRQATEIYAHFAPDALKRAADARARAMRAAIDQAGHEKPNHLPEGVVDEETAEEQAGQGEHGALAGHFGQAPGKEQVLGRTRAQSWVGQK